MFLPLVAEVVLTSVLLLPKFRDAYMPDGYLVPETRLSAFQEAVDPYLSFDAQQTNVWFNTLLLYDSVIIFAELTRIPAGMGISIVREPDTISFPLKSRYLLLDESTYAVWQERPHVDHAWRPVA